ncbi:hypothetical protein ACOY59_09690, partial [Enterobacter roggenkampii]
KSAQIREILISESAWEEMTCLFAPSLSGQEVKDLRNTRDIPIDDYLIFKVSGTEHKKHFADKILKNNNHKIITINVLPLNLLRGNISVLLFFAPLLIF